MEFLPSDISKIIDSVMKSPCNNNCIFCKSVLKKIFIEKEELINDHIHELPKFIHIYPTYKCNLPCKHCENSTINNTDEEKYRKLGILEYKKMILNLKMWLNQFQLTISGGEPFLKEYIIELLKYCKTLSITPRIMTNGTLINRKMAKEIVKNNLAEIIISIDGLEKTHDELRGKGSFQLTSNVIKYIRQLDKNFPISIKAVIWKNNIKDLIPLTEWIKKNNLNITFLPLLGSIKSNLLPKSGEKISKIIDTLIKLKVQGYPINDSINELNVLKKYYNKEQVFKGSCIINFMKILPNGNVYLCRGFPHIGNVFEGDFKSMWQSKKRMEISKKKEVCKKDCFMLYYKYQNEAIHLPCNIDFRDDFLEIIKLIHMWGFSRIILNTNGRMFFYKDFCSKIAKIGINQFNVYLFGNDAKTHDSITGVKGSFEQSIGGIKNLKKYGQDIKVIVTRNERKNETKLLLNKLGVTNNEIIF
jgi:MoaA/NifB/PqqE/SkfB family radical SAM enzyme